MISRGNVMTTLTAFLPGIGNLTVKTAENASGIKKGTDLLVFEKGRLSSILGFPVDNKAAIFEAIQNNPDDKGILGRRTKEFLKIFQLEKPLDEIQCSKLFALVSDSNDPDKQALICGLVAAYGVDNNFKVKANAFTSLARYYAKNKQSQLALFFYAKAVDEWYAPPAKGALAQGALKETFNLLASLSSEERGEYQSLLQQLSKTPQAITVLDSLMASDLNPDQVKNLRTLWIELVNMLADDLVKQKQDLLETEITKFGSPDNDPDKKSKAAAVAETQMQLNSLLNIATIKVNDTLFMAKYPDFVKEYVPSSPSKKDKKAKSLTFAEFHLSLLQQEAEGKISFIYSEALPVLKKLFESFPGDSSEEKYYLSQIYTNFLSLKTISLEDTYVAMRAADTSIMAIRDFTQSLPPTAERTPIARRILTAKPGNVQAELKAKKADLFIRAIKSNLLQLKLKEEKDLASEHAIALLVSCIDMYAQMDPEFREEKQVSTLLGTMVEYMKKAIQLSDADDEKFVPLFRSNFLDVPPGMGSKGTQYKPTEVYLAFYKKFGHFAPTSMLGAFEGKEEELTRGALERWALESFRKSTLRTDHREVFLPEEMEPVFGQYRRDFAEILAKGDKLIPADPELAALLRELADNPTDPQRYIKLGDAFFQRNNYSMAKMSYVWLTTTFTESAVAAYIKLMELDELAFATKVYAERKAANQLHSALFALSTRLKGGEVSTIGDAIQLIEKENFLTELSKVEAFDSIDKLRALTLSQLISKVDVATAQAAEVRNNVIAVAALYKEPTVPSTSDKEVTTNAMLVLLHPKASVKDRAAAYRFLDKLAQAFTGLVKYDPLYNSAIFDLAPWQALSLENAVYKTEILKLDAQFLPKAVKEEAMRLQRPYFVRELQALSDQYSDDANLQALQQLSFGKLVQNLKELRQEQQFLITNIQQIDREVSIDQLKAFTVEALKLKLKSKQELNRLSEKHLVSDMDARQKAAVSMEGEGTAQILEEPLGLHPAPVEAIEIDVKADVPSSPHVEELPIIDHGEKVEDAATASVSATTTAMTSTTAATDISDFPPLIEGADQRRSDAGMDTTVVFATSDDEIGSPEENGVVTANDPQKEEKQKIIAEIGTYLSPTIMAQLDAEENLITWPQENLNRVKEFLAFIARHLKYEVPAAEFDKRFVNKEGILEKITTAYAQTDLAFSATKEMVMSLNEELGYLDENLDDLTLLDLGEKGADLAKKINDQEIAETIRKIKILDGLLEKPVRSYEGEIPRTLGNFLIDNKRSLIAKVKPLIKDIDEATISKLLDKALAPGAATTISLAQFQFACTLEKYIADRREEQNHSGKERHTFFGKQVGIPAGQKIAAAEKVINYIFSNQSEPLVLNGKDIKAFGQGRLQGIKSDFETIIDEYTQGKGASSSYKHE